MKDEKRKDLESLLSGIEFPGEERDDIEHLVEEADLPSRVMNLIGEEELRIGKSADNPSLFSLPRGTVTWSAALLLNTVLILLFENPDLFSNVIEFFAEFVQRVF